MIIYTIKLAAKEKDELTDIISKGKHSSQAYRAAYILLNCDKGEYASDPTVTNSEIERILKVGARTCKEKIC